MSILSGSQYLDIAAHDAHADVPDIFTRRFELPAAGTHAADSGAARLCMKAVSDALIKIAWC
ncbi:MAG: hypothetical protein ACE5HV_02795 [Acidobacteriota bacterium]